MDQLRDEVDAAVASHIVSQPATFDEVRQLPFLMACIRESFRLCPSTPLFPRFVAEPGISFGEAFIPAGTEVAASPWITMRDSIMYGQDATSYRPERWLEASPAQQEEWNRYDFHWGYGNRLCMGKHIAMIEIFKVTFEVWIARYLLFPSCEWRVKENWNIKINC